MSRTALEVVALSMNESATFSRALQVSLEEARHTFRSVATMEGGDKFRIKTEDKHHGETSAHYFL